MLPICAESGNWRNVRHLKWTFSSEILFLTQKTSLRSIKRVRFYIERLWNSLRKKCRILSTQLVYHFQFDPSVRYFFSVKLLNVWSKTFKRSSSFVCFDSFNVVPQVSRIRKFLTLKQNQLLKLLFYKSQQRCEPAGTKTGLPWC